MKFAFSQISSGLHHDVSLFDTSHARDELNNSSEPGQSEDVDMPNVHYTAPISTEALENGNEVCNAIRS